MSMAFGVFRSCFCLAFGGSETRLAWHLRHTIRATFRAFPSVGSEVGSNLAKCGKTSHIFMFFRDSRQRDGLPESACIRQSNGVRLHVGMTFDDPSPDLRYVGNRKSNISREMDEGRNIPAMKRGAKRFLPASSGNPHAGQNGQMAPLMIG